MPHVDIVYDRYHMQAQFGKDVLGVVRLDEAKAHNEQSKRIKEILNSHISLATCYAMKEEMRRL